MRQLGKSIVFFKCFEAQKMGACIKNDLRQRYGQEVDDVLPKGRSDDFVEPPQPKPIEGEVDPSALFSMMFGFDIVSLAGSEMILAL